MTAVPAPPAPSGPSGPRRPPLRRPERERWVAGVAAGLALHLGVPVRTVRLVLLGLVLLGGAGVVLYVWFWVTVPSGDAADADGRPPALARLAPRLRDPVRRVPVTDIALAVVLLVGAVVLVAHRTGGIRVEAAWVVPTVILLAGAAIAWSQLDDLQRGRVRSHAGGRTPVSLVRLAAGVLLVGVGVILLVGQGTDPAVLAQSAMAALAVLAGAVLVLAPWGLRLARTLGDERAARARESERADIAAHLHDSVLQTLALIRSRAQDADDVARLARAQERELRAWLYDDRPTPGTSLASDLADVVAEVEDHHAVAVESVVVGDRVPDAGTEALLQATREALLNAVRHGRPPVSLYLEVGEDAVDVFVRDRGDGFDLDAVPDDRFGVRESIMGRMRRRGGRATVTSSSERGTEVHLHLPTTTAEEARA